jgi:beta-lactamase class A
MISFRRAPLFALLTLACLVGGVGGYLIGEHASDAALSSIGSSLGPILEQGTSYTFVHPLLGARTPEATLVGDYVPLKDDLQRIVDIASGTSASRAAVYFRDLDAGLWIGINQNDTYYPASLLKVPTMIALYKESEEDPSVLDETAVYDPSVLPNAPFDAPSALAPGTAYSVKALIGKMITDSDNGATFTLLARIDPDFLHQVYVALGVQDPGDNSVDYQISARTYGLFFRILYNATYLSPAYSEQALKLLSQATFKDGLVAGVPKGTAVAHKFGEHVLASGTTATGVELSDCGIVYYPSHPYLLCVMTAAKDEATAASTIASISKTTYAAVDVRYATAE